MEDNYFKRTRQEIENRAKNKLATMSEQDIEIEAKKYKKREIIGTSIVGGLAAIAFIVVFCCFPLMLDGEKISVGLLIFCIAVALFCIGLPFAVMFTTLRKSNTELALLSIKKEMTASVLNGAISTNNVIDENFTATRTIKILASGWTSTRLLVDNANKKFVLQKGKSFSKAYNFSDLINYEVYENGLSKVKGTAGKALIGGAFFGLGGLIVGSSMSKNIKEKCNQLKLIIRINDISSPQIVITYIDNVDWDKSGFTYRSMKDNLQEVCSMLEFIINAKTLEEMVAQNDKSNVEQKSNKEQLQELKEMLEDGLITQEEYEAKKRQILGL